MYALKSKILIYNDDRDQWLHCFDYALDEVNAAEVKTVLKQPMFRMADFLVNT
jgi:truncated hemoglobin YjbI